MLLQARDLRLKCKRPPAPGVTRAAWQTPPGARSRRAVRFRPRGLRECLRAARPMLAGRPHEAVSNGSPRWMAAGPRERVHRTRPTGRLARRLTWEDVAVACDWGTGDRVRPHLIAC